MAFQNVRGFLNTPPQPLLPDVLHGALVLIDEYCDRHGEEDVRVFGIRPIRSVVLVTGSLRLTPRATKANLLELQRRGGTEEAVNLVAANPAPMPRSSR